MSGIPAFFIDRDGTIIEDQHYPRDADKVALVSNAIEGLKAIAKKGYTLFVVSNQSGVGRGIIQPQQFQAVHNRVASLLRAAEVTIAEYFYCFHRPEEACDCRKPRTGLIPRKYHGQLIDFSQSYTVGDKDCDVELGRAVGATGLLVLTGKGKETWDDWGQHNQVQAFSDLKAVAEWIPERGKCV